MRVCMLASVRDIMHRIALKEFLQHSKESKGVLGQATEHLEGIYFEEEELEPFPVGACLMVYHFHPVSFLMNLHRYF